MKVVYAYDSNGWFTDPVTLGDSDMSPLELGVYLIPGNSYELEPPTPSGGRWPRLVNGEWVLADRSTGDPLTMPDTAALRLDLVAALTAEYERRMQAIAVGYPPSERESWPVQTSEAYTLQADPQASTPWIDAASAARGLDRLELAQRIVSKDLQYRVYSGTLSGVRQRIEDQIDAAGDDQAALQAIDITAGWPE